MIIKKVLFAFKISILIILLTLTQNCKTREEAIKELEEENIKYNRFNDDYINYRYINYDLGLTLAFDGNWIINARFKDFDNFQKTFARYFYSELGEVLFVGYNEEKKIGIRCTCEKLEFDNAEYLERVKKISNEDIEKYKIKFIKDEDEEKKEIALKNLLVLQSIFETTINENNIFKFNSVIFKKDSYNFKVDIWTYKDNYELEEKFIASVLDTIDFMSEDEMQAFKKSQKDNTDDVIIK